MDNFSIRASALVGYSDCPRRGIARLYQDIIEARGYRFNKVKPSIGALVGTSVHSYIERYYKSRLEGVEFLSPIDQIMSELETQLADGVEWDDTTSNKDTAKLQIERMAREYVGAVGQYLEPLATEVELEAQIQPGWVLTGHIDLVCKGAHGVAIRDTKTGKTSRLYHAQLGGYSLLYRSAHPVLNVDSIWVDFICRLPKKRAQTEAVISQYSVEHCERMAFSVIKRIISDFENFIKTGDHESFLCNPMSLMCNSNYCIAYNTNFCPITMPLPEMQGKI